MKRLAVSICVVLAGMLVVVGCVTEDTTNPSISIVQPADNDTLAAGNILIKAYATDNKEVVKVEFRIDGTLKGTDEAGVSDTFRYTWDASGETAGSSHGIEAKAFDAADNTATASASIVIAGGGGGTGPTPHSGAITADETWWPSGNPHIIEDDVSVQGNATLTIKPGCVVKFTAGTELYCGYSEPGAIVALGTQDSAITFTSNVASQSAGDWRNIGFYDYTMPNAALGFCKIEYAGSETDNAAVYIRETDLRMDNCTIENSGDYGVWCDQNGYFESFTGNTMTTCARYPMRINAEYARTIGTGNTFTGNTNDGIEVRGGWVVTTGSWAKHDVPYVIVEEDVAVEDPTNSPVLTIAPGTTIKMAAGLEFYAGYGEPGGLIADGTSGQITFTSALPSPSPGDWKGVAFYDKTINGQCKLDNCRIACAGSETDKGAVYVRETGLPMDNCTVENSGDYGVWCDQNGYFETFTGNAITTCAKYPMRIEAEYARTIGTGNTFTGNTNDGIEVRGGYVTTTGTWAKHDVPYVVAVDDVAVEDPANSPVLTIAPGTTVMMKSGLEFYVGYGEPGGMIADGTGGQITFTSAVATPSPGDWRSISFYSHSIDNQCKLNMCKIEYGGSDYGNIYIDEAVPQIRNDSIGNSNAWGIYLSGTQYPDPDSLESLYGNTFYNNASGSVHRP